MRFLQGLASAGLIVAAAACGGSAVERFDTTWTVDSLPIVDIAGVDATGKVNFELPGGATRLSNGSVLVADRITNAVRLFDANGKLAMISGRQGEGPGEFQLLLSGNRCGRDSMIVWDARGQKASMIGESGAIARQFAFALDSGVRRPMWDVLCTSDGTIAYLSEPSGKQSDSPIKDVWRANADVVVADHDGRMIGPAHKLVAGEWVHTVSRRGSHGGFPRPLGVSASVTTVGTKIVFGVSDSAKVVARDPAAAADSVKGQGPTTVLGLPIEPRRPTRAQFNDAAAAISMMAPNKEFAAEVLEDISLVPMPALAPAFSALFGDPDGLLWVQTSTQGSLPVRLLVIRLDGTEMARISLARAMVIYEIGRDYILGSYSDASDEMHIVVLRLNRK